MSTLLDDRFFELADLNMDKYINAWNKKDTLLMTESSNRQLDYRLSTVRRNINLLFKIFYCMFCILPMKNMEQTL